MEFAIWMEENELLPPIPTDCVRLTNFTNPTVGPKLLAGGPFLYGRGMISSTTDAFSNNNEILNLLKTGKTGAFDRNSFGNDVVLIDMPNTEHRQHNHPEMASGEVDNSRILGIYNRQTMSLQRNPNYNPAKPVKSLSSPQNRRQPPSGKVPLPPQPIAMPAQSSGPDVW